MSITIERYTAANRDEWDDMVRRARARHFLFERAYMDYHVDRFVDASLMIRSKGGLVAVLPASRHDDEVVSHGGLTFGGLLSGPDLTVVRAVEALQQIVALLHDDGVRRFVYKPVPHIYHLSSAEEDLFALHEAGASVRRRQVAVAVPPGPRPAYSTERLRAIRRGQAAEATRIGESDRIEDFMVLVGKVLSERHGTTPVHTAAEMRLLSCRFPRNIRLFVAEAEEVLVAGVLIYETPTVAHAQYIASDRQGALDALFHHLLTEVYADRWFDFGSSHERAGELNPGLVRQKEGFGARTIIRDHCVLELAGSRTSYR